MRIHHRAAMRIHHSTTLYISSCFLLWPLLFSPLGENSSGATHFLITLKIFFSSSSGSSLLCIPAKSSVCWSSHPEAYSAQSFTLVVKARWVHPPNTWHKIICQWMCQECTEFFVLWYLDYDVDFYTVNYGLHNLASCTHFCWSCCRICSCG